MFTTAAAQDAINLLKSARSQQLIAAGAGKIR
jgi:hypothetical protein